MSSKQPVFKYGRRPHPLLTDEALATRWASPQLSLSVYAIRGIVTVYAHVEWLGDDGKLVWHEVCREQWRAKVRPTEREVAEWGMKALARYLEGLMDT